MSQDISLINSTLPFDVEKYIISAFLDAPNLVKFSLVNKSASIFLSNEKFKELFAERHPHLKDSKSFVKKVQILSESLPSNCWKIVSCVFHTGSLNFSESLVRQGCTIKVKILEDKIERQTLELKRIGGSDEQDSDSLIHKAAVEHEKTGLEIPSVETIIQGREEEFEAIDELTLAFIHLDSFKDLDSAINVFENCANKWIAFDNRLLPAVNSGRCKYLECYRQMVKWNLFIDETDLSEIKNSKSGTLNLSGYKQSLESFFRDAYKYWMDAILDKRGPLTEEDCNAFRAAFSLWAPVSGQDDLISSAFFFLKRQTMMQPVDHNAINPHYNSNLEKIDQVLGELCFNHLVDSYAKQPLGYFSITNFEEQINKLHLLYHGIALTVINDQLLKAIYSQHHLRENPTPIPENITAITVAVYTKLVLSIAEQSNSVTMQEIEAEAERVNMIFSGISKETVVGDLVKAIKSLHGQDSIIE